MANLNKILEPVDSWSPTEPEIANMMASVESLTHAPANRDGVIMHLRYEKKKDLIAGLLRLTGGETEMYIDAARWCQENGRSGLLEDLLEAIDAITVHFALDDSDEDDEYADARADLLSLRQKLQAAEVN